MKKAMRAIVYATFYLLSLLPYKALYALSGILYAVTYHILRYRLSTARRNLATAFPEKSRRELRHIERGFYRWLSDYFVETVKLMTVSHKELMRHVEFRGTEAVEDCFDRGQACAGILGHYCNWELLTATGRTFTRHKEAVVGLVYAPIPNKTIDSLFIKIRQSMGGVCVPKKDILRYLVSFRKENHFHEEVVEMIYKRLWDTFRPARLMVAAMYTRRGGIDINPLRCSHREDVEPAFLSPDTRLGRRWRQ